MKKTEMILAILLILVGIGCLTMSGTILFQEDFALYFQTFIQVCLWIGVPILITGILYFIIFRKGDK